jgi:hypothetical protein
MDEQRRTELSKPGGQSRIYIGGEIIVHHLTAKGYMVYTLDRFDATTMTRESCSNGEGLLFVGQHWEIASICVVAVSKSEEHVQFIDVMYAGNMMQESYIGVVRSGDQIPQQVCIF